MRVGGNDLREPVRSTRPGCTRTRRQSAESHPLNEAARPFLFGAFTAVDAMYAPVVLRLRTYEVELPRAARIYYEAMLALPAMQEWIAAAERESESIPQFDMYG